MLPEDGLQSYECILHARHTNAISDSPVICPSRSKRRSATLPQPSRRTVEDYRLGWAETVSTIDLASALAPIFLLRLSGEIA